MNFRNYINEITNEDEFKGKTLKELELLLQHHSEDAEEYKNSKETAYQASLEDIKAIKKAIKKLKRKSIKANETKRVTGNQNIDSTDTMSVGGEPSMASGTPASNGPGQGND